MLEQRTVSAVLFGAITVALLCVNAPQARLFPQYGGYWIIGMLSVFFLVVALGWLSRRRSDLRTRFPAYSAFLVLYALILALVGGMHYAGLSMVPGNLEINQFNVQAINAMKQERAFTMYYLFFPAMLLALIEIQRVLSFRTMIRFLAFAGLLTALVAICQAYFDSSLLHAKSWGVRYEGLATDPNAMALTCFLLIPLLALGCWIEMRNSFRIAYLCLIVLLGLGAWTTGNRTGFVGILMLFLVSPWLLSISMHSWRLRSRVILGLAPVIVCLAGLIAASNVIPMVEKSGLTGERLAATWQKFESDGIHGVFFQNEQRGRYLITGMNLVLEAPWAGWGPAGFYREATNMFYSRHGWRGDFRDSPVNHYLMIASDFGIPALALNLTLVFIPIILGIAVFRRISDSRSRLTVATLVSSNLIFLLLVFTTPPSYFMGAVWLWSIHLVLLLAMASQYGVSLRLPESTAARALLWVSALLLVLLVSLGSYETSFGEYGYAVRASHPWWRSG